MRDLTKDFDITKYEFSDSKLAISHVFGDSLGLSAKYYQWSAIHGYTPEYLILRVIKSDAIAIAKAWGVTAEDLK